MKTQLLAIAIVVFACLIAETACAQEHVAPSTDNEWSEFARPIEGFEVDENAMSGVAREDYVPPREHTLFSFVRDWMPAEDTSIEMRLVYVFVIVGGFVFALVGAKSTVAESSFESSQSNCDDYAEKDREAAEERKLDSYKASM